MTSLSELDVYQVAYLCGGPQRVALAAVAAMAQDGRVKISRTRHRVQAVHRRAGQPVERAVLDAVPASGKVLGPLLEEVAHSAAVQELIEGLRRGGLIGHHSLAGHPHLSAAGRAARKDLEDSGAEGPGERRVAVLGTAGITNAGLRGIFETPDPPRGSELVGHRTRKSAARRPYSDIPPDPPVPGYPGIPGRW
ncbi:MAG TPA: TIGR04222 domain-containing membrane protein [Trebonia sp.]